MNSSMPARILLVPVRMYRAWCQGRVSPCRFEPSCSLYAMEALGEHGAWRGGLLTARRLARCRPGGGRGFDPVPAQAASPGVPFVASERPPTIWLKNSSRRSVFDAVAPVDRVAPWNLQRSPNPEPEIRV